MENPTIVIKRTKEDLRTYNVFSAILRKPFFKLMEHIGPGLGIACIITFVFYNDVVILILGLFLGLNPYLLKRSVKKSSDSRYDRNNLGDFEVTLTFNRDNFTTLIGTESQQFEYNSIYIIYQRKKDMFIYVSKSSGLYINKESHSEEEITAITSLLQTAIPDKIKTLK